MGRAWAPLPGPPLLASVALLLLLLLLLVLRWRRRPAEAAGLRGPWGWPLVGNALQLGRLPHRTFWAWARRYGEVFRLRLGSRAVVVLNGGAAIREALLRQGAPFAGRPDFPSFRLVSGGKSMAFGGYTARSRAQRKAAQASLRALSASSDVLERHVAEEARELVARLVRACAEQGGYVDPAPLLAVANANVMCALCFGRRYGHDDAEFRALLGRNDRFGQTVASGSLVDVLPWLQRFPNPVRSVFRDFQALNEEMHAFVGAQVAQQRRSFLPGRPPRHLGDALLSRGELSGEEAEGALTDLFGAGQDTTSAGLAWVLLLLLRHPALRRQLQRDLDRVVGPGRLPAAADRPALPRLEAFLCETLRFTSFVPLTIPHAATSDAALGGRPVPAGTVVFVNQWSANHDPRRWEEPHRFDPGRFLDAEQQRLDKDRAARVLLFSLGKRRCVGERVARLQLFLFAAILLHQGRLEPKPGQALSLEAQHGLVLRPRPFLLAVSPRAPGEEGQAEGEEAS
ncbi:cytochrome P450 1B1-like [Anolis carolinensis]|uniref:cytochrome P450 1B1-like n=1 Tax=Anolis carolinensis TaxID=28377 RepID=UPI002F2B7ED4